MELFNKYFWIQMYKYNKLGVRNASLRYLSRNKKD